MVGKLYISNTFSVSMIKEDLLTKGVGVTLQKVTIDYVKKLLKDRDFISCVGHESTARFLSTLLGIEVPHNRVAIEMDIGDRLICCVLKFRPEESKVYTFEELMQFYLDGKIGFFEITIEPLW